MTLERSLKPLIKAKIKATAIHGSITLLVSLITAALVFLVWYPSNLAKLLGGTELFLLVLGVEVCLGPLMSLVIFNPAKPRKELIRDYTIVGVIQLAALSYGLHSTFVARPVYVVFVIDRLEVVSAVELDKADIEEAQTDQFQHLPVFGPKKICVERPKGIEERNKLLFSGLAGKDIHLMPKYYRNCRQGEWYESGKDIQVLVNRLKLEKNEYSDEIKNILNGKYVWLPIKSRFGSQVFIFSKDGDYAYIGIDPFFED